MWRRKPAPVSDTAYLDPELLQQLQARLKRIEGHIRGVNKMLEERRPCDDILTQLAGVKAAVNQVSIKLLEGHLEMCIAESLRQGDGGGPMGKFKSSLERVVKQS